MQARMHVSLTFARYLHGRVRETRSKTPTCRVSLKIGMTGTKSLNGRFCVFWFMLSQHRHISNVRFCIYSEVCLDVSVIHTYLMKYIVRQWMILQVVTVCNFTSMTVTSG